MYRIRGGFARCIIAFKKAWQQLSNGALIRAVDADGYAVLLTNDKNMADQQSLVGRNLAVVALPLNRRSAIMTRVEDIADTIFRAKPGQHVMIGLDGTRKAMSLVAGQPVTAILPRVRAFDA